jgi:NAD(P)-dependent dehydrogenase (short-subunit alcohol dehydrogenase family)
MIIFTGASGGLGKSIIKHLLKIDRVIGIYNNSVPRSQSDKRLTYEKLNIENPTDIKSFVDRLISKLSRVTIVHFAAVSINGLAANYTESNWDRVMGVNLRGSFLLTQAFLPVMIQERWGRIIYISSIVGMQGRPGTIAYAASKSGLLGMSRVLAKEYARFNITSNVLALGYFEKGLINTLQADIRHKILDQIPSKQFGKVSNIANAIQFLIKSEYVNGAVINIDGAI